MEEIKDCKWYHDEFCTNGDSPCVADYCPVVEYYTLCKYYENDTDTTVGMIRRAPPITPEGEPYVRFTKPNAHKTIFTFSGSVEDFKIYKQLQKLEDDLDSGALNYVTHERIPIDRNGNFIPYAIDPTDRVLTKTEYRDYLIREVIKIIDESKASMSTYLINKITQHFHLEE
jgi:hypothetical protein